MLMKYTARWLRENTDNFRLLYITQHKNVGSFCRTLYLLNRRSSRTHVYEEERNHAPRGNLNLIVQSLLSTY